MVRFLRDTTIGRRIALVVFVPLLGMLVPSAMLVSEKAHVAGEMSDLRELTQLDGVIGALVHELQKERGASAVFLGSKGTKFGDVLAGQRRETDARLQALEREFATFDEARFGSEFAETVGRARSRLASLERTRVEVSALKLDAPTAAGWYTQTNAALLDIVEATAEVTTDAETSGRIAAYTQFMQGKERAGIERALGSGSFSAGAFSQQIYNRFAALIAAQSTYFDNFRNNATPEQAALLDRHLSAPVAAEVHRMRAVALASPFSGDLAGITGPQWFKAITSKIDLLKEVEDLIATDLIALAAEKEATATASLAFYSAALVLLVAAVVALGVMIARSITRPLLNLKAVIARMADGERGLDVPHAERGDEIGAIARAMEVFRANLAEADELAEREATARQAKENRARVIDKLLTQFNSEVQETLSGVSVAADSMTNTSHTMTGVASRTNEQAVAAAAATQQASANVQTVAAAAEQLAASIDEITNQVNQSTRIAGEATEAVRNTNARVQGLADAATKIGEVVGLITDIAEQTNLLALNATIEAARAGDAGKGFAVVASEVKNLANQTAKATDDIAAQVAGIQSATGEAVQAINAISGTIERMTEISTAVAAAIEQQGAATGEIARNVQQAASGADEAGGNVNGVRESADETGRSAQQVLSTSQDVANRANALQTQIASFLDNIRAA